MQKIDTRFARFAWSVLAYNVGVILWGAYVRATGSGAGCGNHWPLCEGQGTLATLIELAHRATSGIDLMLVAILVVWAFRTFPRRHPARLGAVLSAIFLITEALIGAALVLLEHVAKNASVARAYSLSTHLINTLTLLACLTLTAWWGGGHLRTRFSPSAMVTLASVMLLGVTGAIAALADTLFPATSLSAGLAQDFEPSANFFLRLRGLHPVLAAAVGTWLIWFAATRMSQARVPARAVLVFTGVQLTIGLLNLVLLAPVSLQMVHLLVADLLWIALVLLSAS